MSDNKSITDKVLARIEHEAPRSRTYFMLRNALMWSLAGLSIFIGALAVSSTIFRAVNARSALGPGRPPLPDVLLVVPFLWLALIGIFGYLAYREVRSTSKGYKYEFSTLMLGTVLASVVLGVIFYATGAGFALDRAAARLLPLHHDLERIQREHWQDPEDGFLIGEVATTTQAGIQIDDPDGMLWNVTFSENVPREEISALRLGERVGLRGEVLSTTTRSFLACDIRSLEFAGRGPRFNDSGPPPGERNTLSARSNECEDVRPLN